MTGHDKWVEDKAAVAAFKASTGDFDGAIDSMNSMRHYSNDTDATRSSFDDAKDAIRGNLGADKATQIELLQPLVDALKSAGPTNTAKAMKLD